MRLNRNGRHALDSFDEIDGEGDILGKVPIHDVGMKHITMPVEDLDLISNLKKIETHQRR